ncbi:TPA: EAL domain-containing protein [Aeromonas salmonicida]|jgi:EAL domain-containing protein (putative c-di-GMP-specific phosphodiesterase class I)|uniref:EAL domain-containing protein n=1 Tax=Aeromonas salmonicida TaxID=645 RepID=UPI001F47C5A7|nr:EAL domain-containing protein [Aeromonas salmonicida]MCE9933771.1 EAL domain-containing protein [Aeromonas salmonicida]HDO1191531.1 EAL domain-containing protein [Aeromonas salmonicida]
MIFYPAFQPIFNVDTGAFVAAEVLARWYDGGRVVSPSNIKTVVNWGAVDIEVARFIENNISFFDNKYRTLFINVSEQTLGTDKVFRPWAEIINHITRVSGARIVIEITESVQDSSLADRWNELAMLGGELALDDYGDLHSSIKRLRQYPWGYCKFDTRNIHSIIDRAAIQYCLDNGVELIAEQVETKLQEDSARSFGLLLQQGFYHGSPEFLERIIMKSKVVS